MGTLGWDVLAIRAEIDVSRDRPALYLVDARVREYQITTTAVEGPSMRDDQELELPRWQARVGVPAR